MWADEINGLERWIGSAKRKNLCNGVILILLP